VEVLARLLFDDVGVGTLVAVFAIPCLEELTDACFRFNSHHWNWRLLDTSLVLVVVLKAGIVDVLLLHFVLRISFSPFWLKFALSLEVKIRRLQYHLVVSFPVLFLGWSIDVSHVLVLVAVLFLHSSFF
jgi:hypothetical protein